MLELKNYCNAIIANTEVPPNAEAQAQDRRKTTRPSNSKPPSHRYYINQTGRSPLPSRCSTIICGRIGQGYWMDGEPPVTVSKLSLFNENSTYFCCGLFFLQFLKGMFALCFNIWQRRE